MNSPRGTAVCRARKHREQSSVGLTSEVPDRGQQDCVVEEFIRLRYSWFSTLVLKDQQRGRVDGSPTLGDFSQFARLCSSRVDVASVTHLIQLIVSFHLKCQSLSLQLRSQKRK